MARQNVDERRGTAIRHGKDGPFHRNAAGHAHATQFGGRLQQRGKAILVAGKADMGIHGVPTARRPFPHQACMMPFGNMLKSQRFA